MQATSIGKIGIEFDQRNNRVKGIIPKVIGKNTLPIVEEYLTHSDHLADKTGATRITMRFFSSHTSYDSIKELGKKFGYTLEAIIPFDGISVYYLGKNADDRKSDPSLLAIERKKALEIRRTLSKTEVTLGPSFRIERMADEHVEQLHELYRLTFTQYPFELNPQTLRSIMESAKVLVAINSEGRIVSSLVGESIEIPLENSEIERIRLVELSEAATHPDYRAKGLLSFLVRQMVETIKKDSSVKTIIYGEARASHIPANVILRKNGAVYAGTLEKHCLIESVRNIPEEGIFENLNVWYFQ